MNEIEIIGKLCEVKADHASHGKIIYKGILEYTRPSGTKDKLDVLFDESVRVPKSDYVRILGEIRERAITEVSENVIHAYSINEESEHVCKNDVSIEGEIVRHGKIRYAKSIPFINTVMKAKRENAPVYDYVKVAVFGKEAYDIVESGRGKTGYVYGRYLQSQDGAQISARGITWR